MRKYWTARFLYPLVVVLITTGCQRSSTQNADGDMDVDQTEHVDEADSEAPDREPPDSPACKNWMGDDRYLDEDERCCDPNGKVCCAEPCEAGQCQWEYEYDWLDYKYDIFQSDCRLDYALKLSHARAYSLDYYFLQYYDDRYPYKNALVKITGEFGNSVVTELETALLPAFSQVDGCESFGYSNCLDTPAGHLAINDPGGIRQVKWGNCFGMFTPTPDLYLLWNTVFETVEPHIDSLCMDFEPPEDESTLFEIHYIRDSDGDIFTLTVKETDLSYSYRHTRDDGETAVLAFTGTVSQERIDSLLNEVRLGFKNPVCVVEQGECIIPGKGYIAKKGTYHSRYVWLSFDCPVTSNLVVFSHTETDEYLTEEWQAIRTLLQELVGDDDPDLP